MKRIDALSIALCYAGVGVAGGWISELGPAQIAIYLVFTEDSSAVERAAGIYEAQVEIDSRAPFGLAFSVSEANFSATVHQ